jgi:predicted GTPase
MIVIMRRIAVSSCVLRMGVLPADVALAKWLRAAAPPRLVLAANKCERRARDGASGVGDMLVEATRLGLGEPVAISAETGKLDHPACAAPGCVG